MSVSHHERKERILEYLNKENRVTVAGLSGLLAVSEATVRRDLDTLAEQGVLIRTHGGALKKEQVRPELPFYDRRSQQTDEKKRIAHQAAAMIQEGETVFIGSGTTAWMLASFLRDRCNCTVITNSLPVVNELSAVSGVRIITIGGNLRKDELSMVGHIGVRSMKELRADKVFIGMRSVHPHHGLTNEDLTETETDRTILDMSDTVILLVDNSKFNKTSPAFVAPVSAVNVIITDNRADPITVANFRNSGITVILA